MAASSTFIPFPHAIESLRVGKGFDDDPPLFVATTGVEIHIVPILEPLLRSVLA